MVRVRVIYTYNIMFYIDFITFIICITLIILGTNGLNNSDVPLNNKKQTRTAFLSSFYLPSTINVNNIYPFCSGSD